MYIFTCMKVRYGIIDCHAGVQGSQPTWKTLQTWNFVIYFSRPGKCMEISQNVDIPEILTQDLEKNLEIWKFSVSRFTFKISFMTK